MEVSRQYNGFTKLNSMALPPIETTSVDIIEVGINSYKLTLSSIAPPIHRNCILQPKGYYNEREECVLYWETSLKITEKAVSIFDNTFTRSFASVEHLVTEIENFSSTFFTTLIRKGYYYPSDDFNHISRELVKRGEKHPEEKVYTFCPSSNPTQMALMVFEDGKLESCYVGFNFLFGTLAINNYVFKDFTKLRHAYGLRQRNSLANIQKSEQFIISKELREKLMTPELLAQRRAEAERAKAIKKSPRASFGSNPSAAGPSNNTRGPCLPSQ